VKCRSCNADIDAKAIVCYRCGAPTADPVVRQTGSSAGAPARWRWVAIVILVVLAVAACVYYAQVK
jgi:predicted amidophosphoribosyltransferase